MNNIFFDLDGTLIDVSRRHYTVYETCIKQLGCVPISKAQYWSLKKESVHWDIILKASGLESKFRTKFLDDFISLIEDPEMLALDSTIPGGNELIKSLYGHYNLYLVSLRRSNANLLEQLRNFKIDKYFSEIVSGHSDGAGHEHKTNLIRSVIKADDNDSIIIGDTEADIRTAKKLGYMSIAVLSGMRNEQMIMKESPDRIVNSVADIDIKLIELLFQKGKVND